MLFDPCTYFRIWRQYSLNGICCCLVCIIFLIFTTIGSKKKGKKKGVTLNLSEFLADTPGVTAAPGSSYVVSNKPGSWADDDTGEDADGMNHDLFYSHTKHLFLGIDR